MRLEYLHSKNYVHRDIKPDNFCIGSTDTHTIYLIDFGLATKYKNSKTGEHYLNECHNSLTGTARFASLCAHKGETQTRKDDLEGLGYVLLYFLKGSLPWQGLAAVNKKDKYEKIYHKKQTMAI